MGPDYAGAIATAGVIVAGIAGACLVLPAGRQLGTASGIATATATLGLPVVLIPAISGYPAYGAARSTAIAVVVQLAPTSTVRGWEWLRIILP